MSLDIQILLTFTTGKNEKVHFSHVTTMKFIGKSGWFKKIPIIVQKIYDFCEYVKFGTISLKIDIL